MRPILFLAFACIVSASQAQDLQPRDYSPSEDVPIRVAKVGPSSIGSEVLVVIGNRTAGPIDVSVDCSLYRSSEAIGSESVIVSTVPPGGEAAQAIPTFTAGATSATCRITDIRDAD